MRRSNVERVRDEEFTSLYRHNNPRAAGWAAGYGPIEHGVETQARVFRMAELLASRRVRGDGVPLFEVLPAADRAACAAMWLVVHETYARNIYLNARVEAEVAAALDGRWLVEGVIL